METHPTFRVGMGWTISVFAKFLSPEMEDRYKYDKNSVIIFLSGTSVLKSG